jgi:hypothetical protein
MAGELTLRYFFGGIADRRQLYDAGAIARHVLCGEKPAKIAAKP